MPSLGILTSAYNLKVGSSPDGRITTTYSNNVRIVRDADGAFRVPGDVVTFKNVIEGGSAGGGAVNLSDLLDVNEINKQDGALIQYSSSSNEYRVDFVTLDAGEF